MCLHQSQMIKKLQINRLKFGSSFLNFKPLNVSFLEFIKHAYELLKLLDQFYFIIKISANKLSIVIFTLNNN